MINTYDSQQAHTWFELLQTTKTNASDLIGVSRPRFDKILDAGASDTESLAMRFVEQEHVRSAMREVQVTARDAVQGAFHQIEVRAQEGSREAGYRTFIKDAHGVPLILPDASLVIVTGQPMSGKSSLMRNLAASAALEHGRAVCHLSLELLVVETVMKLLCQEARLDVSRLKSARLKEQEWARLIKAGGAFSEAPLHLMDRTWELDKITGHVRDLHARGQVELFFLDDVHLVNVPHSRSTYEEVSHVTRALKRLAQELDIIIVASARSNRKGEQRYDARPCLSNLRDSGHLEHDAQVILALYRDELSDPESLQRGQVELHTLKHSDGALGMTRLRFRTHYTRFDDMTPEQGESDPNFGNV